jgi:hypothetical protein
MTDAAAAEADLGTAAVRVAAALDRPGAPPPPAEVMAMVAELHGATVGFEEARKIYALTVARHNAAIGMFPLSVLAAAARLEPAEPFG